MKKLIPAILICLALFGSACHKTGSVTPTVDSLKIGLLAYYNFTNNFADSSGNGFNGLANNFNFTTDRNNKSNAAVQFNGINSSVVVKDTAKLRLNNTNFSLNVWINMDDYNSSFGSEILCKRGTGSKNGWNYSINGYGISNGGLIGATSFQLSGGTDTLAAGSMAVGLTQWRMLTTTYDFSKKQISFYINGVLDKTIANIPSPVATAKADLYIGADSQSSSYHFKGKIDDVRIYNRVLPLTQIRKLYLAPN